MTTRRTINALQETLPMGQLPAAVIDAIYITKKFGPAILLDRFFLHHTRRQGRQEQPDYTDTRDIQ